MTIGRGRFPCSSYKTEDDSKAHAPKEDALAPTLGHEGPSGGLSPIIRIESYLSHGGLSAYSGGPTTSWPHLANALFCRMAVPFYCYSWQSASTTYLTIKVVALIYCASDCRFGSKALENGQEDDAGIAWSTSSRGMAI